MANVIQEFLVALKPQVDKKAARRFKQDQQESRKVVKDLSGGIKDLALAFKGFATLAAVTQAVQTIKSAASSFTDLYNASKIAKVTPLFLDSLSNTFKAIGFNGEAAKNSVAAFANFIRQNPATKQALGTAFGVSFTGDNAQDYLTVLRQANKLLEEGGTLSIAQLNALTETGISYEQILAYSARRKEFEEVFATLLARDGQLIDDAANSSKDFTLAWVELATLFKTEILPYFTAIVKHSASFLNYMRATGGVLGILRDLGQRLFGEGPTDYDIKRQQQFQKNLTENPSLSLSPGEEIVNPAPVNSSRQKKLVELTKDFIGMGYSPNVAKGFAANAIAESGGNASAYNPDDKGSPSYGLFQFRHPSYYKQYGEFSGGKNLLNANKEEQEKFIHYLLTQGSLRGLGAKLKDPNISAAQASNLITREFERPANVDQEAAKRSAIASGINLSVNIHGVPLDEKRLGKEIVDQASMARLLQGAR